MTIIHQTDDVLSNKQTIGTHPIGNIHHSHSAETSHHTSHEHNTTPKSTRPPCTPYSHLLLQKLEAVLVEDVGKLVIKLVVVVPGTPRDGAVWLHFEQHVQVLLHRLQNSQTGSLSPPPTAWTGSSPPVQQFITTS